MPGEDATPEKRFVVIQNTVPQFRTLQLFRHETVHFSLTLSPGAGPSYFLTLALSREEFALETTRTKPLPGHMVQRVEQLKGGCE